MAKYISHIIWLFTLALVLYPFQEACAQEKSSADKHKLAVVELIEDHLANAFTIRSADDNPDFGNLDRIFPQWHNGEPAEERRGWTFHGLLTYKIKYVVHSVHEDQPGIITAQGRKRIVLTRLLRFWIFPPELKRETFSIAYTIKCRQKRTGEWIIVKETNDELFLEKVSMKHLVRGLRSTNNVRSLVSGRPSLQDWQPSQ